MKYYSFNTKYLSAIKIFQYFSYGTWGNLYVSIGRELKVWVFLFWALRFYENEGIKLYLMNTYVMKYQSRESTYCFSLIRINI